MLQNVAALEAVIKGPGTGSETREAKNLDDCTVIDEEAGAERPVCERGNSRLLSLPYEIRRMIYQYFFDEQRTIHLTFGPLEGWVFMKDYPAEYHISRDGIHLQLACKQISEEVADLIYKSNDFVFAPGEFDYNTGMRPYRYSVSNLWLNVMRPSILERVRNLEVLLALPSEEGIPSLSQWLSKFPRVKIAIMRRRVFWIYEYLVKWRSLMGMLCESIATARSNGGITIWDDSGDLETAKLFRETLPKGFLVAGKTAIQNQEVIQLG